MPTLRGVHSPQPLANVALKYRTNKYVGDTLFPMVPVDKQSDKFYKIDTEERDIEREERTVIEPGEEATEIDWANTTDTYSCEDHALAQIIPDAIRQNADQPLQREINSIRHIMEKLKLGKELKIVAALKGALASRKQTLSGTDQFDHASAEPIDLIKSKILEIQKECGERPNKMVMDFAVFIKLTENPQILSRISGGSTSTNPSIVTLQLLAELWQLEEIAVASNFKNTSKKGQAPSRNRIWSDDVFLGYVTTSPDRGEMSLGYDFVWNRTVHGVPGFEVEQSRESKRKSDLTRLDHSYDIKVVAPVCGYWLEDTLAAAI